MTARSAASSRKRLWRRLGGPGLRQASSSSTRTHTSASKAVLEGILEFEPELLILPAPLSERQDKAAATIERLVRVAPTDVLVLDADGRGAPRREADPPPDERWSRRPGAPPGRQELRRAPSRSPRGDSRTRSALVSFATRLRQGARARLNEEQQKLVGPIWNPGRSIWSRASRHERRQLRPRPDRGRGHPTRCASAPRNSQSGARERAARSRPALALVRDSRVAGPGRLERFRQRLRVLPPAPGSESEARGLSEPRARRPPLDRLPRDARAQHRHRHAGPDPEFHGRRRRRDARGPADDADRRDRASRSCRATASSSARRHRRCWSASAPDS